jgi:GntR family transcriptional regulator
MIDQGGGRHTYQAIAWAIREKINNGDLAPGDSIPSLPAIRTQYDVSYATAQAAVGLLKTWGLVRSVQGRGTFVLEQRPVINLMSEMTHQDQGGEPRRTWKAVVADYGMEGTQRVTGAGRDVPPVDVADALGLDAESIVAWRQRLLLIDGQAAQICTTWYPDDIVGLVPALVIPERLPANSMELLAQAGRAIAPGRSRDVVFARAATEEEATTLGIELGAPVTETLRTARDDNGEVVTVERMVSDSGRLRQAWVI